MNADQAAEMGLRLAALVLATVFLSAPAMAEDPGTFTTNTINGVRVWSPKPSPQPAYVPARPPQTIVIETQSPVQSYEQPGLPYYPVPFLIGPHVPGHHPNVHPQRPMPERFHGGRHF